MRLLGFVVSLTCLAACATAPQRPAAIPEPQVELYQVGSIFFGSGTTAPVTFEIDITNRAAQPIIVRRVEISSPGMVEYTILPRARVFNERIEAGAKESLTLLATAYTGLPGVVPAEPLGVRLIAEFEANGQRWRRVEMIRVVPQR